MLALAARSRPTAKNSFVVNCYSFRLRSSHYFADFVRRIRFGHARTTEGIGQSIIPLVTRILVDLSVNLGDNHIPQTTVWPTFPDLPP